MAKPETDWLDALQSLMPDDADTAKPEAEEVPEENPAAQKGRVDIILDKKGRHGKVATIISGFDIVDEQVAVLASKMKSRLGCGGSARGGEILIQGDRRNDVAAFLNSQNIKNRII